MQFVGSFTTFNPVSGYFVVPYVNLLKSHVAVSANTAINDKSNTQLPLILDWMAGRAQKRVHGRPVTQIARALDRINYILHLAINRSSERSAPANLIERIADEISVIDEDVAKDLYTPARLLKSQIPSIDIANDPHFPNANWDGYFAVLTLAILGNIHRLMTEERELSAATVALAAEAMEALTLAENPTLFAREFDQSLQKRICLRNQRNAIEGHAVLNAWKERFREWVMAEYLPHLNRKRPNRHEAARQFKAQVIDPALRKRKIPALESRRNLVRVLADSLTSDLRPPNP
jgi:hypothetical protein